MKLFGSEGLDQRGLPGSRCSKLLLAERRSGLHDDSSKVLFVCLKVEIILLLRH